MGEAFTCRIMGHKKEPKGILEEDLEMGLPIVQMHCTRCGIDMGSETVG